MSGLEHLSGIIKKLNKRINFLTPSLEAFHSIFVFGLLHNAFLQHDPHMVVLDVEFIRYLLVGHYLL